MNKLDCSFIKKTELNDNLCIYEFYTKSIKVSGYNLISMNIIEKNYDFFDKYINKIVNIKLVNIDNILDNILFTKGEKLSFKYVYSGKIYYIPLCKIEYFL